jgi:hypothetical protein
MSGVRQCKNADLFCMIQMSGQCFSIFGPAPEVVSGADNQYAANNRRAIVQWSANLLNATS